MTTWIRAPWTTAGGAATSRFCSSVLRTDLLPLRQQIARYHQVAGRADAPDPGRGPTRLRREADQPRGAPLILAFAKPAEAPGSRGAPASPRRRPPSPKRQRAVNSEKARFSRAFSKNNVSLFHYGAAYPRKGEVKTL